MNGSKSGSRSAKILKRGESSHPGHPPQREFLERLGVEDIQPFRFAEDDRKLLLERLQRVLKRVCDRDRQEAAARASAAVDALEFAVLRYQLSTTQPEEPPSSKKQLNRKLPRLRNAAAKLREAIAAVSPDVRDRILERALAKDRARILEDAQARGWFSDEAYEDLQWGVPWQEGDHFVSMLHSIESEAQRWLDHPSRDPILARGRGRPRDSDRDALEELALDVGRVLRDHGVRLKKSRSGDYAEVLGIVRDAVKRPLPVESLREIAAAVDLLQAPGIPRAGTPSLIKRFESLFLRERGGRSRRSGSPNPRSALPRSQADQDN